VKKLVKNATRTFVMSSAKGFGLVVGLTLAVNLVSNYTIKLERVGEYDNS
jgi:hypothetical protein